MSYRYSIRVPAEAQKHKWGTLLPILEELLPVEFSFTGDLTPETAGEIVTEGAVEQGIGASVSTFRVPDNGIASRKDELIEIAVQFLDDPDVPFPFRGRKLRTKASKPTTLTLAVNERPLATCEQGPVWACSAKPGAKHFRSAFALPEVPTDGGFQDVLSSHRFLEVLPLVCWLREICANKSCDTPSLRACFIFDDPNLHWPRYGFVDYRRLAMHAERENYHIAFATIPLDTWFTHSGTAAMFRKLRSRLSLLIHGNNHTKGELARHYTGPQRVFLLRQAIRRIERLEARSGLAVSRAMVPPHGACSEEMLAALPGCGFEAACISHGSLRHHNKTASWTKTLGYRPYEIVRGCPVLPRWGLSGDVKNAILLAAYFKQAIILRGHHQDLKEGPEVLDDLAGFVNGLGSVKWMNMTDLVRSSYLGNSAQSPQIVKGNGSIMEPSSGDVVTLEAARGASSEFAANRSGGTMPRLVADTSVSFIRRLLTEARDRLLLMR
jgi:hypothetical protein